MNNFASEKKSTRRNPLEPTRKGGLDAPARTSYNSQLLGSQIAPFSSPAADSPAQSHSAGGLSPMSQSGASMLGGPIQAKKPPKISAPVSQDTNGIKLKDGDKNMTFMSSQSRAIYEMTKNATEEQLRTDETLRKLILDDYRENMAARLQGHEGDDYQKMYSSAFRSNTVGELSTYNRLVKASMPEGMIEAMSGMNDGTDESVEASLDFAGQQMQQDPVMNEILMAGMDAFGDSKHFSGENVDRRSEILMNNVMLRGVAPQFTDRAVAQRDQYATDHGGDKAADKKHFNSLVDEAVATGVGRKDIKYSVDLQKAVKEGGTSAGGNRFKQLFTGLFKSKRPEHGVSFGSSAPGYGEQGDIGKFWFAHNTTDGKTRNSPEREGLVPYLNERFKDKSVYGDALTQNLQNASGSEDVSGLSLSRLTGPLMGALGEGMSKEQIGDMYEKLMQGGHYAELRRTISAMKTQIGAQKADGKDVTELEAALEKKQQEMDSYTPEQVSDMDKKMDEGKMQLKGVYYSQLKRLRDKYGKFGSQMHPEDFMNKVGPEFFDEMSLLQDCEQMMHSSPKSFDFDGNEEDREFRTLSDYYNDLYGVMNMYASSGIKPEEDGFEPNEFGMQFLEDSGELKRMLKNEAGVIGPGMDDEQLEQYVERLQKRMKKGGKLGSLFGRFK